MASSPLESKAAFARRLGVSRSTVTRAAQSDRLVINVDGLVLINESLAKWESTKGARSDVEQRHAQNRGHAIQTQQGKTQAQQDDDIDLDATEQQVGAERAQYKAAALDFGNKKLKLEEALNRGIRIGKQQHHKDIALKAKQIKSAIEILIDNLSPQLIGITDKTKRATLIKSETQKILEQI